MKTVERGAALLDERMPGWEDRIDLDTLDLHSSCNCILGQLYAHPNGTDTERINRYRRGQKRLGITYPRLYGFTICGNDYAQWSRLTEAWRRLIRRRRKERGDV